MNEETQIVENLIYSYITKNNVRCYTPNGIFASTRAVNHETYNVYEELVQKEEN
jgi:hypothetical protein